MFGLWCSCVSTGNILGGLLSSLVLSLGGSWQFVFFVPGALMMLWTIFCVAWLQRAPLVEIVDENSNNSSGGSDGGGIVGDDDDTAALLKHESSMSLASATATTNKNEPTSIALQTFSHINSDSSSSNSDDNRYNSDNDYDSETGNDDFDHGQQANSNNSVGFLRAWLLPGVAAYAVCNAFTKLVSYALLLWLPLYYTEALDESEEVADLLATLYDVGGVVGGICFGALSDYTLKRHGAGRSLTLVPLLLFSALTLYLYQLSSAGLLNMLLLIFCGMFSNSAVRKQKIQKKKKKKKKKKPIHYSLFNIHLFIFIYSII